EFQRAARAVTGKFLDKAIVDTVFLLFDADGDGHLSPDEFMSFIRSYIARGTRNESQLIVFLAFGFNPEGSGLRSSVFHYPWRSVQMPLNLFSDSSRFEREPIPSCLLLQLTSESAAQNFSSCVATRVRAT
ncbi:unnamed protein product, partial [Schistocephalus solidus]|uniref:EF-hand domain-containing protein n=1 Tax=Schistocephalus solidus TaxID=70667 RepID=A0A183TPA2_SCHSO